MRKKGRFLKFLGWTLATLAGLAIVARLSLAPLASWALIDWFEQQGIESRVDDVSFEIGEGRFELRGLAADAGGETVLRVERIEVEWSWSALRERQLLLSAVSIDGLEFDIEQAGDGQLIIAAIDLSAETEGRQAEPAPREPLDWSLLLNSLEITNTAICFRQPPRLDLCTRLAGLDWQGSLELDLAGLENRALPLRTTGALGLSGLEIRHNGLERVLLGFESLDLTGMEIDGSDAIAIGEISLSSLDLFERAADEDAGYIQHLDRLNMTANNLQDLRLLTIGEVTVAGNAITFVKSEQNRYELDEWLEAIGARQPATPSSPATEDSATATTEQVAGSSVQDSPTDASFEFALGKLTFETRKPLQYRDLSLGKPFLLGISSTELVVANLDSREPGSPSDIDYRAKLDDDSLVEIEGTATPLAAKPSFDMEGEIRALDLRRLSPFTAATIGYTIKSGQLDADIELFAEQAVLDSEIDLTLYRFDLQPLSKADAEKAEANLGFPLNASLSLLKNREGTIELNIPVTGDLTNPDVSPRDAINQALSRAITTAILNYYTPFGLVTAANALFSMATALKFEPVVFESGAGDLDEAQGGNLDKIATLMQERPGIQLRLCPYTNTADREALLPETAGLSPEEIRLEDTQPPLVELGEARSRAVEQYLVDKQVDSSRLISCDSTHEEGEGLAGVEISI